jgi:uncharacterized protein with HEPN domain
MKRDKVYLQHILDAIDRITGYVAGKVFAEFESDLMAQDAVIRQFSIIGEAARRISLGFQSRHPAIPWADIIGMRNILIHDYLEVDLDEVWKSVQDDLPDLRTQITALLKSQ